MPALPRARTLAAALALLLSLALGAAPPARAAEAATASARPGHLTVSGPDLLGPDGKPILLRGWNWGHWGKAQARDAADNAAQGANVVRIPLRWWGYYRGPDIDSRDDRATATAGIDPKHLAMLDDMVRWASAQRLWIVLFIDSNCGQNGLQDDEMVRYCDREGRFKQTGHNFFVDPAERERFVAVWRFIARRYKDTPYLGLFEPLPEPGSHATSTREIGAFYDQVMAAIRQEAPGIPFLVGANNYKANKVRDILNPAWKDVVYTGNLFPYQQKGPQQGLQGVKERLQALVELRAQARVPVFVQQVGVRAGDDPDMTQLRGVLEAIDQARVGYTYWEYRGAGNPGEYGVLFEDRRTGQWLSKPAVLELISQSFRR